ncbi:MAG: metallophosphoesterase [bacterium]|nr:metallophosphoesterase [bacterium]
MDITPGKAGKHLSQNRPSRIGFLLICLSFAGPGFGRDWNSPVQIHGRTPSSLRFVVIGDRTGSGPDSWGVLDRAIAETNRLKPDFAVHIGDLISGGSSASILKTQWDEALRHLDSLRVPLFLVPGNHDISNPAGRAAWVERFGVTRQAFDFAGSRFILLDTESEAPSGRGGLGPQQTAFLRKAARSGPQAGPVFIFMHRPAWILDGALKTEWESARPDSGSAPVLVFSGHLHILAAEKRGGIRYFSVGPTGGNLRLTPNPGLGLLQHITAVSFQGNEIRVEFIDSGRRLPEAAAFEAAERGLKTLLLLRQGRGEW